MVVYAFSNLVLYWIGKGACVSDISGKTGISVVENDDAQSHSIAGVILAGFDVVNSQISVAVIHHSIPSFVILFLGQIFQRV
jgi:hypothetical protein